jgi:aspartate/methionine/tyrosine aminotransferase
VNRTLASVAPYASKKISQAAKLDRQFISLSIGEPWFGPVPAVHRILHDFSGPAAPDVAHLLRHYANGKGEFGLRTAVARCYRQSSGMEIDPDKNVLIAHGGSQAFLLALLALTEEGDEVLVPDPTYMLYENTCHLLGRTPVRWQAHTTPIGLGGVEIPGATGAFEKQINTQSRDIGGLAQYENGNLSLGFYAGITLGSGRAFGGGAYITLSWSGCHE